MCGAGSVHHWFCSVQLNHRSVPVVSAIAAAHGETCHPHSSATSKWYQGTGWETLLNPPREAQRHALHRADVGGCWGSHSLPCNALVPGTADHQGDIAVGKNRFVPLSELVQMQLFLLFWSWHNFVYQVHIIRIK